MLLKGAADSQDSVQGRQQICHDADLNLYNLLLGLYTAASKPGYVKHVRWLPDDNLPH
jgi:hypothetical protein